MNNNVGEVNIEEINDEDIINLFLNRNPQAIVMTKTKYEKKCFVIANTYLHNHNDVEECLNDVYHKLWNKIPPDIPDNFISYLHTIVRRTAISKYRSNHTIKMGYGDELPLDPLDPFALLVIERETPETNYDKKLLTEMLNHYLKLSRTEERIMFIYRFFYGFTYKEIGLKLGLTEDQVSSKLYRFVIKIKKYFIDMGWDI